MLIFDQTSSFSAGLKLEFFRTFKFFDSSKIRFSTSVVCFIFSVQSGLPCSSLVYIDRLNACVYVSLMDKFKKTGKNEKKLPKLSRYLRCGDEATDTRCL